VYYLATADSLAPQSFRGANVPQQQQMNANILKYLLVIFVTVLFTGLQMKGGEQMGKE
jgi:hypothetical protein